MTPAEIATLVISLVAALATGAAFAVHNAIKYGAHEARQEAKDREQDARLAQLEEQMKIVREKSHDIGNRVTVLMIMKDRLEELIVDVKALTTQVGEALQRMAVISAEKR